MLDSQTAASPAIDVFELTVSYAETVALDRASLVVDSGTVCGLIGVNGSGKSTLFKAIVGFVKPESGGVLIHGESPSRSNARATVGYVPQSEDVDWTFPITVREVVMMGRYGGLGMTRRPHGHDRISVDHALVQVGLEDLADRQIGALSGGQRKRAFLARAIAQDARVLLLDEPFTGVDARSTTMIVRLLRAFRDAGNTVLVATHDLSVIPEMCDEAALFKHRVLFRSDPKTVLEPQNLALAFGNSRSEPSSGSEHA